ncbi:MAG TPA: oxygenase MpaB family protein [Candidatus Dormibacteraeota bacterium]|nr:oxygenase MpaB family protein [Candidatus Dormibacteraeota bacterium]
MEMPTDRPLFPPDSATWRVNQEPALLLAGGRALLMQLAHPGVAAGVDEHSDYRHRPLRRLARTLQLTMAISFGTRAQALAAAQRINTTHRRVRGRGYTAMDPELLLWVHATLIDSALVAYRTFVGPLSRHDEEGYYQEATVIGPLLGIPSTRYPSDLESFQRYLRDMLEGDQLRVDDRARALAGYVLRPRLRLVPGLAYWPVEVLTAGLLPERLRRAYRLRWGRRERLGFTVMQRTLPKLMAVVPRYVRRVPPARRGARAWARAAGHG